MAALPALRRPVELVSALAAHWAADRPSRTSLWVVVACASQHFGQQVGPQMCWCEQPASKLTRTSVVTRQKQRIGMTSRAYPTEHRNHRS